MLTAFARAFRTPDLRKKLLFTLSIVVVYRLGAHVPVPGIDYTVVNECIKDTKGNNSLFGLVNMFSGGALLQLTIFALGIMPYITASIILQLLTVVIPRLEALKKEGQAGTTKITQYTRYLTVALAVLQGTGLVATARSGSLFSNCTQASQIVPNQSIFTTITMV
ncbi:preprotein translocase subunit SecY, partial [Actinacidiphila rubida]